jgi:hypothetical protein
MVFDDGMACGLDLESEKWASRLRDSVFDPLRQDSALFRQVRVDSDFGTLACPNIADIDSLECRRARRHFDGFARRAGRFRAGAQIGAGIAFAELEASLVWSRAPRAGSAFLLEPDEQGWIRATIEETRTLARDALEEPS